MIPRPHGNTLVSQFKTSFAIGTPINWTKANHVKKMIYCYLSGPWLVQTGVLKERLLPSFFHKKSSTTPGRIPLRAPFSALPGLGMMLLFLLAVTGCGTNAIGYGVVLLADEEMSAQGLKNGDLVTLASESDILDSYTIVQNTEEESVTLDVPRWRIQSHETREAAQAFQAQFIPYATIYGRSGRQGLPIRSTAQNTSPLVYRMRRDEEIKIISRHQEQTNIAGLEDYWYEVLTETGVRGWTFGYDLTLVDASETVDASSQSAASQGYDPDDPLQAVLFEKTWRPEYYLPMIRDSQFNLELFRPEFGFFANAEQRIFTIRLKDYQRDFPFSSLYSPRYARYQAEGSSLQITVSTPDRIVLEFEEAGAIRSEVFTAITEDIGEVIQEEQEDRIAKYQMILDRGTQLTSSHYGSIQLFPDFRFTWTGYQRLGANFLPRGFDGTGRIAFTTYLGSNLTNQYTGVITLTSPVWGSKPFLFEMINTGIRLEPATSSTGPVPVVINRDLSPLIMFFEFGGPTGQVSAPGISGSSGTAQPTASTINSSQNPEPLQPVSLDTPNSETAAPQTQEAPEPSEADPQTPGV